ncbi:MAG: sugar phosphate isomerase/epimerase [Candidatus Bathyarchaeum tardum]|nr:MAG: sugar phosphate isomerase/epimerase [Candidatus Bathyarchaeum tardum]
MDLIFGFDVVRKPVEDYFEYASKYGLSHLEIDLIRENSFIETFDAERIFNLRNLSEDFDISLSLHTPFSINPSDKIPTIRDATITYLRRCVAVAYELNATHVTTHVGYCLGVKPSKQKALNRLVMNLKQVLRDCQEFGVNLAIENVNPMPENSEMFYLADSIEECTFLLNELDSQYINLCLDTGHANINEGPLAYLKKFGKKIINIHFHDNNGKTDDHLDVGQGTIPWKKVVEALKAINFYGPYVSECFNSKPHEAKKALLKYF